MFNKSICFFILISTCSALYSHTNKNELIDSIKSYNFENYQGTFERMKQNFKELDFQERREVITTLETILKNLNDKTWNMAKKGALIEFAGLIIGIIALRGTLNSYYTNRSAHSLRSILAWIGVSIGAIQTYYGSKIALWAFNKPKVSYGQSIFDGVVGSFAALFLLPGIPITAISLILANNDLAGRNTSSGATKKTLCYLAALTGSIGACWYGKEKTEGNRLSAEGLTLEKLRQLYSDLVTIHEQLPQIQQ